MWKRRGFWCLALLACVGGGLCKARPEWEDLGDDELERYFERRVEALETPLGTVENLEQWKGRRKMAKRDLREMLGIEPLPERTDLAARVTGKLTREDFTVENVHFQSMPGLYVTGNLYLPRERQGPVPAVLYVCGHGPTKIDGVSFGNKVTYQHHGIWFARNGYACLVIDSLQLGEIEAIHHGLYRYDRWWWVSRGYTPAGVEAWNCMRALDYLQSRSEIDGERLGVTGRSGGGAYSWWIAALDERIAAAVPVAGITSLRDHVVHGCVEGHCDCMYQVNLHGWDFEEVAALVAPRALLISNTDKDAIFPLGGVYQVYNETRRIYDLYQAGERLGLNIEEGPHKDTQPLRTSAFHWMNRFLRGADRSDTFEMAAVKMLEPAELKVFAELPGDEVNTRIDEIFVPRAGRPDPPEGAESWEAMKKEWMDGLQEGPFRGWPSERAAETRTRVEDGIAGMTTTVIDLVSEPEATCWMTLVRRGGTSLEQVKAVALTVLDEETWENWNGNLDAPEDGVLKVYFCPRGIGPRKWTDDARKLTHIRRRFLLVGQSLDAMRSWDIRQAVRTLRGMVPAESSITLRSRGAMAGNALYASLFLDVPVEGLDLSDLPTSHDDGPHFPGVLKVMDLPQAVVLAAERSKVTLEGSVEAWQSATRLARAAGIPEGQLSLRSPVP